ncbi:cation:dicarboxylase symporter family transporter [Desulfococcaceae bacterium HSG9]|nr:cation:dicarboxylase symporter family transporter [Desulfococcaceae bacterium HSG9]
MSGINISEREEYDNPAIGFINNFFSAIERYLPALSVLFFIIGICLANISASFVYVINDAMETFIDSYNYLAPVAIYLILTPTLIKLFSFSRFRGRKFANRAILWFVKTRIIACVFAVVSVTLIFDLPLYSSTLGFTKAMSESLHSFAWMLGHSVYFYALYASGITVVISLKYDRLAKFLVKGVDLIEWLGTIIMPIIPLFMMGIGAYVTIIPKMIEKNVGNDIAGFQLGSITMLGIPIDAAAPYGMILIYVLGSFLTGAVCGLWHFGLIILAKYKMPDFSLKKYFTAYWVKIYPLLWATSSEAMATPLNLLLIKKLCPDIRDEVRQFVVGTGSFFNINGTMINVFIMTAIVAGVLGIQISFMQLFFSIPIVFLIGYGVPGIPGELLIFAGPLALCMRISPELTPIFLSLYIGLQIGLPDSFRTASNSTDDCLGVIILDKKY